MNKIKHYSSESLSNKSIEKILQDVSLLKKELFTLRFRMSSGDKVDTSLFRKSRRDIARLNTELSRRKVGK